jgi:protein TonB
LASRTYRQPAPHEAPSLRRRAAGFALAIAVNLLLLLVMRGLGVLPEFAQVSSRALVVDLLPRSDDAASKPAKAAVKPEKVVPVQRVHPPKTPRLKSPIPPLHPLDMIEMTHDELAAADIRNLPKGDAGSGSAGDSEEVGRGPHGEILYAAEWVREPTNAELNGYIPANAPDGEGLVICKTIAGNRVDNCQEIGESPRGTHLARAVRLAAWQFKVRPPRKNGRAMVGEWVRIRIDYYSGGEAPSWGW